MASQSNRPLYAYVGNFSQTEEQVRAKADGVYVFRIDPDTFAWEPIQVIGDCPQPSFLVVDAARRYLYVAHLSDQVAGLTGGAASAYAIDPTSGKLTFLNRQPTGGEGPCFVSIDASGKFLLLANYISGSAATFAIQGDGSLGPVAGFVQHAGSGPNQARQEGPHAHSITPDPSNRFALVADLGADRVFVYRLDPDRGKLEPNDPPYAAFKPGAGPRHLAFHPNGRFVYVANELDSTMTVLAWDGERGALEQIQNVSTVPESWKAINYPADIHFGPSGKHVYVSNREHDSLAIYAVSEETGRVSTVGWEPTQGSYPRHFTFCPMEGRLIVANQNAGQVFAFRVDEATGKLSPLGPVAEVTGAACVQMVTW